jgi:hypothetical protein
MRRRGVAELWNRDKVMIGEAVMAASCLAALGSEEEAPGTLRAMAEQRLGDGELDDLG